MSDTDIVTVRLDRSLKEKLNALAKATRRSNSFLAAEAIANYVESQEWQLAAIREGLADAERGALIDHDEIEAWVRSWGTDDELPPPEPK